ncbi:MAG: methyltransferase, TrmH family [Acidobacteriota bacterium]|nr:methyltransferase, TrmH family [Acidobacteriota bacterium]
MIMSRETIKSRKNPLVQRARAVRDGRERDSVFVEGVRLCEDALSASVDFEVVLYTQGLAADERGATLLEKLRDVCPSLVLVVESVLESVSDTKTPQGIVALARRPQTGREIVERAKGTPLIVVMHGANNPSNAGAMLRVAEAAGATAAILTKGSTHPLTARALRGSMGSAFRLALWTGPTFEETLRWCAERGIRTVTTDTTSASTHTEFEWTNALAVILGPEAVGLSDAEVRAADESVRIPMREPVESLNVAVALAVVLYEAARQRGFR